MEDVLEVYHRDYDSARPVLCLDEASKQLVAQTRQPVPAAPGRPERIDYEYERRETALARNTGIPHISFNRNVAHGDTAKATAAWWALSAGQSHLNPLKNS